MGDSGARDAVARTAARRRTLPQSSRVKADEWDLVRDVALRGRGLRRTEKTGLFRKTQQTRAKRSNYCEEED